jgi:WD40 repeat protein
VAQKPRIFISYSRTDIEFAEQLVEGLERDGGLTVAIDKHSIAAAEDWKKRLGDLILANDTVVFVLSPDSIASQVCEWEVERARALSKRIIPVLWRPIDFNKAPLGLSMLNSIAFNGANAVNGLSKLIVALNSDLDWLRAHTALAERAVDWESTGKGPERLLRGAALVQVQDWLAARPASAPEATQSQLDYISASEAEEARLTRVERLRADELEKALVNAGAAERERAAASRRVVQRTFLGLTVASVLAVAASGAAYLAYQQAHRAQEAQQTAMEQSRRAQAKTIEVEAERGRALAALARAHRARLGTIAEQNSAEAERLFKTDQLEGLILALQTGRGLQDIAGRETSFATGLGALPAVSPLSALIGTIPEARVRNHLKQFVGTHLKLKFSPNGKILTAVAAARSNLVGIFDVPSGREVAALKGRDNEFSYLEFSPDSMLLATGGHGILQLSATKNGDAFKTLSRDPGYFYPKFTPDGRIVAAFHGKAIRMWNVETGTELPSISPVIEGWNFAFAPSGKFLAARGNSNSLTLWDVQSAKPVRQFGSAIGPLTTITFGRNDGTIYTRGSEGVYVWEVAAGAGTKLANASNDNDPQLSNSTRFIARRAADDGIEISEVPGGKIVATIPLREGRIGSFDFHPTDDILLLSRMDGTVAAIRATDGIELFRLRTSTRYSDFRFSPDGRSFASGGEDGSLKLWSMQPSARLATTIAGASGPLAISPDSRFLAVVTDKHALSLWDLNARRELSVEGDTAGFDRVDFTSDSKMLAATKKDATTSLWDALAGKPLAPLAPFAGPEVISADGNRQATYQDTGNVVVRELPSGRQGASWKAPEQPTHLWLSADGRVLAVELPTSTYKGLQLVGLDTNTSVRIPVPTDYPYKLSFSAGNGYLIFDFGQRSQLWNATTGEQVIIEGYVNSSNDYLTFSPDGRSVAGYGISDGKVAIWEIETRNQVANIELIDFPVHKVIFSPDGKRLGALRNGGGKIVIWDIASGKVTMELSDVTQATFSPDGEVLATTSGETIKLWQVSNGREIGSLATFPRVGKIVFSPDGTTLVARASSALPETGDIMFWPTRLEAWVQAGCDVLATFLALQPERNAYTTVTPDDEQIKRPLCPGRRQ